MKRSLFFNTLTVILMGFMIFLFSSCTTTLPTETGIVTITIETESTLIEVGSERPEISYYIYMDDVYQGIITSSGALTLQDVPIGIYTFEASNYMMVGISPDCDRNTDVQEFLLEKMNGITCYGSITYEVKPEVNYVEIPVSCGYMEILE